MHSNITNKTLILTAEDIQSIILHLSANNMLDIVMDTMEREIQNYSPEHVSIPARSGFNYTLPDVGLIEWMPLYQVGQKITNKIVGYHPRNPTKYGIPTILSSISQYDTRTGHLMGIADGVLLTALRTGVASAIASKHLAKEESSTLGLIGCGAQAVTQLHALSRIFNIKTVLCFDKDTKTTDTFQQRVSTLQLQAQIISSSIKEIVAHSDIICTATSIDVHEGPLFKNIEPKPHVHINAVGSDFPGKIELPMDIIDRSFLCADFIEQALLEGECQQVTPDRIDADLSELVKRPNHFKRFKNQISVFDSTGWALEDHVIMNIFMDYASRMNIGTEVELECISSDAKNPYHFISNYKLATKY